MPVVIAITETCDSGTAVPNPSTNHGVGGRLQDTSGSAGRPGGNGRR